MWCVCPHLCEHLQSKHWRRQSPYYTNMRPAHAPSHHSSPIREQNAALAQEMNKFSFRQHAHNNCASVHVRVCLRSHHIGMRLCARVCVCVLPVRLHHLYLPIQDIRLTSVVSNTSGTTQRRRVNDVRAIDALNCEAPSCLCNYSPAGRSNRSRSSQQVSS